MPGGKIKSISKRTFLNSTFERRKTNAKLYDEPIYLNSLSPKEEVRKTMEPQMSKYTSRPVREIYGTKKE